MPEFSPNIYRDEGLANARCLLGEGQRTMALDFLQRTYRGADTDGIGLHWEISDV